MRRRLTSTGGIAVASLAVMLHRASNCAVALEKLGFRQRGTIEGMIELERDGEVIVLPENGAVSSAIVERVAEAAGIEPAEFSGMLVATR